MMSEQEIRDAGANISVLMSSVGQDMLACVMTGNLDLSDCIDLYAEFVGLVQAKVSGDSEEEDEESERWRTN